MYYCFPVIVRNISISPINFSDCLSDSDIINHPSSCSLKVKYAFCKSSDPYLTHFNTFCVTKNTTMDLHFFMSWQNNSIGRLSLFVHGGRFVLPF